MKLLTWILVSQLALNASAFISSQCCGSKNTFAGSGGISTCLFNVPEPLAEEGSWQAFLDDETTGLIYYFDTKTGESLWEPPTSTFPDVRLPRKKQRLAEELRRNYRRARQLEEEQGGDNSVQVVEKSKIEEAGSGLPSWIEGLVEVVEEKAPNQTGPDPAPDAEIFEEERAKEGWLSGMFSDKAATAVEDESANRTETQKKAEQELRDGETWIKKNRLFAAFEGLKEAASAAIETDETELVEKAKPTEKKIAPKKEKESRIIDTSPQPIKIEMGSHILPHPSKVRWGGEDALFTKGRTFGVFDGVSGADKLDGVPLYSRTLANEMKKALGKESVSIQQMTKMLKDASDCADDSATGASTAVVASIGENGFLQALNVGDSLCMVVRDGKIAAKTREISHYWECPYQLSDDSPDQPRDGTKLNVELIPGDLIIMGSDGIFDNVSDDMLLDLINKNTNVNPTQLARKICDLSRKQSTDRQAVTPYGKQAQRRGDPAYKKGLGGKVDDASCIVVACK